MIEAAVTAMTHHNEMSEAKVQCHIDVRCMECERKEGWLCGFVYSVGCWRRSYSSTKPSMTSKSVTSTLSSKQ